MVSHLRFESSDVLVADVASMDGNPLPGASPGAHVAVRCGNDRIRHYSLLDTHEGVQPFYRFAVKREERGRGGSLWFHEFVRTGSTVYVSLPRNNFHLDTRAESYLFISGGIGITPILSMLRLMWDLGKRARLVHLCRSEQELCFGSQLRDYGSFHDVHLHFDSETGGFFDLQAELHRTTADCQIYCCGPGAVMRCVSAYGESCGRASNYHFESFGVDPLASGASAAAFVVTVHPDGRQVLVDEGETMLAALRREGFNIDSECEEGTCGTCLINVRSGVPDHRDSYLDHSERLANRSILPCVSRCVGSHLVIEI